MGKQGSGVRGWGLGVGLGAVLLALLSAASATARVRNHAGGQGITVRLYNFAGAPADIIQQAEDRAAGILGRTGVEITWLDCPLTGAEDLEKPACDAQPFGPTDVVMRVIPDFMERRLPFRDTTLGFAALPADGGLGYVAGVFWEKVEKLSKAVKVDRYQILGHAMAHEIGHLLLRTLKHGRTGLMRANWGPEQLQRACRGLLLFAPSEAARLRAEVRARASAQAL